MPASLFCQAPSPVEIADNTPLVLTCGLVVSSISSGITPDFGIPIATDEFDPFVSITYTDITCPGICPQEYSVTRIWTATDNCGHTDVCSRTIFVEDIEVPVMTCPVIARPIEFGTPLNFASATAVDECDGIGLITFTDVKIKKWFKDMNTHQLICVCVKKDGNKFACRAEINKHDDIE